MPKSLCFCFFFLLFWLFIVVYRPSLVVASGLVALQHMESYFPDQGPNLRPLHWWVLNHWTTREVPKRHFGVVAFAPLQY